RCSRGYGRRAEGRRTYPRRTRIRRPADCAGDHHGPEVTWRTHEARLGGESPQAQPCILQARGRAEGAATMDGQDMTRAYAERCGFQHSACMASTYKDEGTANRADRTATGQELETAQQCERTTTGQLPDGVKAVLNTITGQLPDSYRTECQRPTTRYRTDSPPYRGSRVRMSDGSLSVAGPC